MGRAGRWLNRFLGVKKEKHVHGGRVCINNSEDDFEVASFTSVDNHRNDKDKKRWSFGRRSYKFPEGPSCAETESAEGKLAEAAAKAADAAVIAARAAVSIARLTADSGRRRGPLCCRGREWWAAVRIQAVFRGFLARKALKALRGVVKLQSLVRGYMARKQTAASVRTMQALARARCSWPRRSVDKENGFDSCYRPRRSIERNDETRSSFHSKRYSSSWDRYYGDIFDASPKIIEIDTDKPLVRLSISNRKDSWGHGHDHDTDLPSTARGSPFFRIPVTPTRSLCGEFTGIDKHVFLEYPNYMSSTQSFQAKSRSTSTPKQRPISEWSRQRRIVLREIMAARNSVTG